MHRLGHLLEVSSLLQTLGRIRVDAVRALHRVCDGERDQRLLALGQRSRSEDRGVVLEKLFAQLGSAFRNRSERFQVFGSVVMIGHDGISFYERASCASTTAMAAMLTMSLTSTPRWSTCTGLAIPWRMGPIASAPPRRQRSL